MDRLTRYDKKQKHYIRLASRLAVDNTLGKLEDLEEQLGCPLEVFFRLLKERNYYFEHNGKVYYNEDCYINNIWVDEGFISISVSNKELRSKYIFDVKLFFKDYQKTWFLVKQEMNR